MTAFADFYNHIIPELNGVPTNVVDHTLLQVAREFCDETEVHAVELSAINVVGGTAEYTLTSAVTDTEIARVKAVWYDGRPLSAIAEPYLDSVNPYYPGLTTTSPWAYTQQVPDKIILFPEPEDSLSSGLRVKVILKPAVDAEEIVDWVAEKYMPCLAYGVKGRLMAQPAKPWTNPEMAVYNISMYQSSKSEAAADVRRSFTRSPLTVRARPFA